MHPLSWTALQRAIRTVDYRSWRIDVANVRRQLERDGVSSRLVRVAAAVEQTQAAIDEYNQHGSVQVWRHVHRDLWTLEMAEQAREAELVAA